METFRFPVIQEEKTGRRLKEMRKERGIRVAYVCAYMGGISEQAVYKWERGACLPTLDNLLALAHLYHVPMEDLLVYEEAEMASYFFALIKAQYEKRPVPVFFCKYSEQIVFMHAPHRSGGCSGPGACGPSG